MALTVGTLAPVSVDDSASVVTLKAANINRLGLTIYNNSSEVLSVKLGATATLADFNFKIAVGGYWEMPSPIYTGIVTGIWANNSTGAALVAESV